MNCRSERNWIAAYVEGDMGPVSRWLVRRHLGSCAACFEEYERREGLGDIVKELPTPPAPRVLRTRILLAVSRGSGPVWPRLRVRFENLLRPLAIPAAGGVLSALILFGALISNLSFSPQSWSDDVPLRFLAQQWVTHPSITVASPFGVTEDIGVAAFIDGQGKVYDLRMIRLPSGEPEDNIELKTQLANALLTTKFSPAMSFGRPVRGKILILFRPVTQIFVRG